MTTLEFGPHGESANHAQAEQLIAKAQASGATDLLFLAHGFRCDASEAAALYTALLDTLFANFARTEFAAARKNRILTVAGIYWPSQRFPETPDDIGKFLNFMTWTAMKDLAGRVGANGLAPLLSTCEAELPGVRIHLAGHSLGGRVVAACCQGLAKTNAPPVASLSLLQAAFSHYGFSSDAGWGEPGYFRQVIDSRIVAGPLISTFSKSDAVLAKAYALASRLTRDRLLAIGDPGDPFGGIGHNGALRTPESVSIPLHRAGEPYQFAVNTVTCLDGSGGLITSHGDVTNPHVTYAIASAICQTA